MITIRDVVKLLNPIKRKIYLLIGRAVLAAVNNEGKVGFYDSEDRPTPQRVQVTGLVNETLTDLERFQEYGFETYPIPATAEAILVSPDGTRANSFVIMIQDITYRPTDLQEGDSCQYDYKNARILCRDGKLGLGNPDQTLTSTPPGGKVEFIELVDRILTVLQGITNLAGAASTSSFLPAVLAELAKIQVDLNTIKGTL